MIETNQIYNADCIELMKEMPDKCVDLVLTDPPYGVNYEYNSYDDTPENLKELVDKFMPEVLRISKRALITCGIINMRLYPRPDWTMAWVSTAGVGCGPWGFCCWQPILAYGKDPYLENGMGSRPDIFMSNERSPKTGHSCPKPSNLWRDVLLRGSVFENELVFDPFIGSGTTAVACINTRRNFIGIEMDKDYFAIAQDRIKEAQGQRRLF